MLKFKQLSVWVCAGALALSAGWGAPMAQARSDTPAPQTSKPAAPEATPIVGGTSFATAVAVTAGIDYTGNISNTTHAVDVFYLDVQPGQIIRVDIASGVVWDSGAEFQLHDQDHINPLKNQALYAAERSLIFNYMGNTTQPTRYYLRIASLGGGSKDYEFKFTVSNQNDAGVSGDAGDSSDAPRLLTPGLGTVANYSGTISHADNEDW